MNQSFADLQAKALAIRDHYGELEEKQGHRWNSHDRMSGFVGDVGDLSKLVMMKQGLRAAPDDIDEKLAHEINDCLWSIMVLADELGINLEQTFTEWVEQMHARIEREKNA